MEKKILQMMDDQAALREMDSHYDNNDIKFAIKHLIYKIQVIVEEMYE